MSQTQTPRDGTRWSPALAATAQLADPSLMFSFLCSSSRRQQFPLRKRKADRLSRPARGSEERVLRPMARGCSGVCEHTAGIKIGRAHV